MKIVRCSDTTLMGRGSSGTEVPQGKMFFHTDSRHTKHSKSNWEYQYCQLRASWQYNENTSMFSLARGCRNASLRSYSALRSQRECPMQCTTKEISFLVEGQGGKKVYTLMKRIFFTKVYILIGFFAVIIFKQHWKSLLTVAKLLLPLLIDESKREST